MSVFVRVLAASASKAGVRRAALAAMWFGVLALPDSPQAMGSSPRAAVERHWKLANTCQARGMRHHAEEEALVVLRLDPGHAGAKELLAAYAARKPDDSAAPAPANETAVPPVNMAVVTLGAQGVSSSDAVIITDILRNELVKTGACNVLERENMETILAEHAFQRTGCTSEECAVRIGKLLNVKRTIAGNFGKFMGKYILTVKVVDIETGRVIFADSAKAKNEDAVESEVRKMALRIAGSVRRARDTAVLNAD